MDDIKSLVTRFYDTWNAHDRDGWLACCYEDINFTGPGGVGGQGFDAGRMFWSLWQDAFPDCRCTINIAVAEGMRPSRNRSSQARTRKHSACQTVKTFPRPGRAWQSPIRWASLTLVASGQASGFSSTERSS
jgi:SnoaL-like domain